MTASSCMPWSVSEPLLHDTLQEGIVPGGGAALLHLSEYVPEFKETLTDPEERLGADIIGKALT